MQTQKPTQTSSLSQVQSTLTSAPHIVATPDARGGKPRVAGRRITVADIALWHLQQHRLIDEIVNEFNLTHAQVHAALAYYSDHRTEIDQREADELANVESLRQHYPSKMRTNLTSRG